MGDSGSLEPISESEHRDRGRIRMCRVCKYTTTDGKEFSHHQLNAHKEIVTSQYECEDCDFLTLSNIEFARHRKSHIRNSRSSISSRVGREMQRSEEDSKMPPTNEEDIMMEEGNNESKLDDTFEDDALVIDEHVAESSHASTGATSGIESRKYTCQSCDFSTVHYTDYMEHQTQEHQDFEIYECEFCDFATKDRNVLATHDCAKENEKEAIEETQERPESEARAYEEEDDETVPSPQSLGPPICEFENVSDNTQDSGPFVTPSRTPHVVEQAHNEHYNEGKFLEMVKPRSRIIRQEVDPAKYTQINTLEGIRYSCSNCGNVYKWRKSLNKHWKEKHYGETPTSSVPLKVPKFIPSGLVSAVGPLQRPRKSPISFAPRLPSQSPSARSTPTDIYRRVTTPELPLQMQGGQRDSPFSPNHFPGMYGFPIPVASPQDEAPLDLTKKAEPSIQVRPRMSPPELVIPKPTHLLNDVQRSVFAIPQEEPIDFSSKHLIKKEPQSDIGYDLSLKVDTDLGEESSEFPTPLSDNLKCPKCPYVAQFRYDYDRHIELHMRKRTQTCVECQKSFVTIEELNAHFADAHKDVINDERRNMSYKLHPADSCFPMDALPLQDGKTLKCTKCDYMARWPTELQKHAITHSTDRPFVCMVCGSSYKWKWDLVKHFDKSHTMLTNPYKKRDNSPGDPPSLMTPSGSNDDSRDGDVIILDEQPELKRPRLNIPEYTPIHSEVSPKYIDTQLLEGPPFNRPFKCDLCQFSSNYKGGLAVHRRHYHHILPPNMDSGSPSPASSTMTSPSPTLSIPQFSGIDSLANQMKQLPVTPNNVSKSGYTKVSTPGGSGGRSKQVRQPGPGASAEMLLPYKCTVCEYRARWPSEITQHMKNHSDEKPYHCPRCTYKSKWKWDVVKHLKRCGGGTIKDVIDTTKQKDRSRPKFAPPNVTVMSSGGSNTATPAQPAYIYSPLPLNQNYKVVPTPPQQQNSSPLGGNILSSKGPQETSQNISDPNFNNMINQGQYICLQCPFIGNSPAELKRHSVLHSDSKPYVCKSCGYGSKWKCDLKKHLRTYNHEALDPELAAAMANSQASTDDKPDEPLPEMEKQKSNETVLSAPVFPTPMLVQGTQHSMMLPIQLPGQDPEDDRSSQVYNCPQCKYTTTKKHMLEAHQRIHTQPGKKPSNRLTCKQCEFEAEDLPTFLQHKLTHSAQQTDDGTDLLSEIQGDRKHRRKPVKQFRCHKCPYVCFKKSGLEQHESMHEPRGTDTFKCDYCDYNVYSRNLLTQHMRLHPEFTQQYENEDSEEDYQLEYNMEPKVGSSKQRIFPKSKDSRYDHEGAAVDLSGSADDGENIPPVLQAVGLTTPAGAAIMESQKSPKKLSPTEQIFSPMLTYSMQGSPTKNNGSPVAHRCPKCPYVTGHKINFEKHIRMHTIRSKFVCEWCDWSADRLNLLWRHVKLIHPEQLDTFQQDKDEIYGLKRKQGRTSPSYTQQNGSPKQDGDSSQSPTPGIDFNSNTSLKSMSQSSAGRKKNYCNKCGYYTDNLYNLQRHLDQHNKPGRHVCDRCDYSVDRLNLLYQHIRGVHGDQMDGKDPILDEEARSDEDIDGATREYINEKVITLGPKLYKCGACDFTTQNISICNSHAMRHGSNSQFTCDFCDFSMENMNGVYQHMVTVHLQSLRQQENLERLPEETEPELSHSHPQGGLEYREGHIMKCPECPFKSMVVESMERHRGRHGYKGKYTCEHCNYSLDRVNLLYHHMHLHEKSNSKLMNSNSMVPMNLSRSHYMELEPKPKRSRATESGGTSSRVKIRYKCTRCPYATFCKQNIFKHKKQHLIKSKYRCELCTYSATRWFLLQQHMKFHDSEDDPTTQRSIFQDIFLDPEEDDSVVEIERSKVPSGTYKQDPDKLEALARLKSSAAVAKKAKDIKCRLCGFETNSDVEFSTHVECHESGQRYRCDYCDFITNHINSLHGHRRQHCHDSSFIENPPLENILNRNFHEIEYFKMEDSSIGVNMNINYESPKVNYESPNPSPMSVKSDDNSKSASLKSDQSDYECAFCGFVFLTEGEHMSHTQQHGANKKYVCDYCDWSNDVLEDVYAHRNLVHIRSSNYDPHPSEDELKNKDTSSCSENESVDNSDVNSKMMYKCDQCPFECSSKSALGGHMRFHVNAGRHKCDKCNFSIDKLNLLYQHMKLHLSGSTFANHYQCRKCPFITKNRDILQFHVGCHGSNCQFKCNFCDYAVERLASLEQHNKLHSSKFNVSDSDLPVHSLKHYKEVRENQLLNFSLKAPENGHSDHDKPHVNHDKPKLNGGENEPDAPEDYMSDTDDYETHDDDLTSTSGVKLTPIRGKPLKQHLCSKCPYKTTNKSNFISHLAQHRAQSKFTCPYCDYSSARMDQIGMHMRLHFPEAELEAKSIELLVANNDSPADLTMGGNVDEENNITDNKVSDLKCKAYNKTTTCQHCNQNLDNIEAHECQRHIIGY
ncbi:unnamed protein product [Owenia fusiformis]|uniref:Uncharacterized protein n=1 Tax=Owenia fusiformis TaxID=6347 RepID=A0A8J1UUD7_OWEFU|nr:unnamed protein product [Owenia fusiformis]